MSKLCCEYLRSTNNIEQQESSPKRPVALSHFRTHKKSVPEMTAFEAEMTRAEMTGHASRNSISCDTEFYRGRIRWANIVPLQNFDFFTTLSLDLFFDYQLYFDKPTASTDSEQRTCLIKVFKKP